MREGSERAVRKSEELWGVLAAGEWRQGD